MHAINHAIDVVVSWLWADYTYVMLLTIGLLFSLGSKFVQYRAWTHGAALVRGRYDDRNDPGALNHFQALSTALSGTVGLGNIGGVAIAISTGGPGALFWMWVAGLLGMAIKTIEVTLAMIYRDVSDPNNPHGGAMWVIYRGLGRNDGWRRRIAWGLAALFSLALALATVTGGNLFQSWNVANITAAYFGVPPLATGAVLAVLTGLVIIGGIHRIGDVTGRLVPVMCGIYLLGGAAVLIVEAANVPSLLASVVEHAFCPTEAQGAFLGATVWGVLSIGMQRAFFSNEAGQGTSPIAHAAAKTSEPVREGLVAGLEPFVDTCLVCTLTALVILATNTWNREPIGKFGGEVGRDTDVMMIPAMGDPETKVGAPRFFVLTSQPDPASPGELQRRKLGAKVEVVPDDNGHRWPQIVWDRKLAPDETTDGQVYLDFTGAALTGHAFDRALPGLGKWLVTIACWLFALSTMISWSYYGQQAVVFVIGERGVVPFQLIYCLLGVAVTIPGVITTDAHLGNLADLGSGCMLWTNIPIVALMAPKALRAIADYLRRLDAGLMPGHRPASLVDVVEGTDVE